LAGASAAELVEAKVGALRSADLGGGVKLELCGIPAGTFTMGGFGANKTPHEVTLTKPFWLGQTEVTQAQWEAVMGGNPSRVKGKDLPVEQVSWNDAEEFCGKLNATGLLPAGWRFALPTEAQWEYACRAGTTGDYAGNLDEMAWYSNNNSGKTHPVGTKKPNAWGLYDMHGNIAEWCADWYAYYDAGAAIDPTGPRTDPKTSSKPDSSRVIRGDSWLYVGAHCRSDYRANNTPVFRAVYLGFRVAAVPGEPSQAGAVASVPSSGAGARDERAAPLAGTSAAELTAAKVGARRAADLGGGTDLVLLGVPAGTFTMGGSGSNEKPQEVTLTKPFWLGRTEVTQAQWAAVMGSNPSKFKGDPNLPVEQVSWNDAEEFCGALNAKGLLPAGWRFALPTEAQWEYACRAGTTGDYAGELDEMAWYSNNSDRKTHAVGTKKSNAWGLYDMHGNVAEWCADRIGDYSAGAVTDPTGSNRGSFRVVRGGAWGFGGTGCRSAYRGRGTPGYRVHDLGFRVAAVPAGAEPGGAVVPASGAGARDERAAPVPAASVVQPPVVPVVDVSGAKAGGRLAADLGSGVELKLCGIPAGTFTMGSPEGETGRGTNETPHSVTLSRPYWLGQTEVTQGQWQALMGGNPSYFKGDPNLPVENVSWDDAQGFVKALQTRCALPDGWRWTLPSEAQWEYACRAGTKGDYAGNLDEMAWYSANSGGKTQAVGTKTANAWGLSDMHGNVWEWCADWYANYPGGAATDPTGPNTGSNRVARGGSWGREGSGCRSAYRGNFTPVSRNNIMGFRVAAVPGGSEPAGALVPASGAGARDERAAPVPVVTLVDVSGAKAGARREADLGGGVKLELWGIPAGSFTMGGSGKNETPHKVTLTKPLCAEQSKALLVR
jgi:formylglycine-generating enzyme required for sulfatase activity